MSQDNPGMTRFVPEGTTSPDYVCWTLYGEDDKVLGSTLTGPDATEAEAREKLGAEMLRNVQILGWIDSLGRDPDA